jgi:hypothetical protein
MPTQLKYFNDSYAEVVSVGEDGVPFQYSSLGPPRDPREEPELAQRIRELTGREVRFGEWIKLDGDPRDGGAEVPLYIGPRAFERGALRGVRCRGSAYVTDPRTGLNVEVWYDAAVDLAGEGADGEARAAEAFQAALLCELAPAMVTKWLPEIAREGIGASFAPAILTRMRAAIAPLDVTAVRGPTLWLSSEDDVRLYEMNALFAKARA